MKSFLFGLFTGAVASATFVIGIAESRFEAISPLAVVYKLAQNSVEPQSDFAKGLDRVLDIPESAKNLRMKCVIPADKAAGNFSIQCQQETLFELLPSLGRYRAEIKICNGKVCDSGWWRF